MSVELLDNISDLMNVTLQCPDTLNVIIVLGECLVYIIMLA